MRKINFSQEIPQSGFIILFARRSAPLKQFLLEGSDILSEGPDILSEGPDILSQGYSSLDT